MLIHSCSPGVEKKQENQAHIAERLQEEGPLQTETSPELEASGMAWELLCREVYLQ